MDHVCASCPKLVKRGRDDHGKKDYKKKPHQFTKHYATLKRAAMAVNSFFAN